MGKYNVQKLMEHYHVRIGDKVSFERAFSKGDTVTIYDKNMVKWYDVKMNRTHAGVISKVHA